MADDRPLEDPGERVSRVESDLADLRSTLLTRLARRPTGDIEPTIRTTAKPGTLIMAGQTLNRSDFPDLWQWAQDNSLVIAGLFGSGNGSTTFVLPDFRGRVLRGVAATGEAVGALLGADSVTLTVAQLPAHTHTVTLSEHEGHAHAVYGAGGHLGHFPGSEFDAPAGSTLGLAAWNSGGANLGDHSHDMSIEGMGKPHTVTVGNTGSGSAVDNRQASVGVNWLIWV